MATTVKVDNFMWFFYFHVSSASSNNCKYKKDSKYSLCGYRGLTELETKTDRTYNLDYRASQLLQITS